MASSIDSYLGQDYADEFSQFEFNRLNRNSKNDLIKAIKENKWHLSQRQNRDVGWKLAREDFLENYFERWMRIFNMGFKYAWIEYDNNKDSEELRESKRNLFFKFQADAIEQTLQAIMIKTGYFADYEVVKSLFFHRDLNSWASGYRQGGEEILREVS